MTVLACACGKRYDVRSRTPGTRVQCRVCAAFLTVPEPRESAAVRTASERLRAARGAPCKKHPRQLADRSCEECGDFMCPGCRAPEPSSHLCRACAQTVGATRAIPLDFGLFATPLVALRAILRTLGRLVAFNLAGVTVKWLLTLLALFPEAAVISAVADEAKRSPESTGAYVLVAAYCVAAALVAMIWGLFDLVLIPAGDVLLLDQGLRGERGGLKDDLAAAARRAWSKKGALALTYVLLVFASALFVVLPLVLAGWLLEGDREVLAFLGLLGIVALGAALGSFGLALPAMILEHRSAPQALERAWRLTRLRPLTVCALGALVVIVCAVFAGLLRQVGLGDAAAPLALGVPAFALDLAWPALLVAAYHGLVAEEAQVFGRRS